MSRLAITRRRRKSSSSSKLCSTMIETEEIERELDDEQSQSCDFENLPPEVLEMVFKMLSYKDIAGSVRLVSKNCASIATTILNAALLSSGHRLRSTQKFLDAKTLACSNQFDLSMYFRARNYLEYVGGQLDFLRAVVSRYTHPLGGYHQKFGRVCFYAGTILDELDCLLRWTKKCPSLLLDKDGPAPCIFYFSGLCKKFMNFFEKVTEKRINKNSLISGCKSIDILDCLLEGREQLHLHIPSCRSTRSGAISMKLRYVMKRSWFTSFEMSKNSETQEEENSWRDQQRFMYLRLRRLVGSVNEHKLEKMIYDMELLVCTGGLLPLPKAPSCSTYSGYGDYAGRFYYYGNMNEYAFENKVLDTWRRNLVKQRVRRKEFEIKPPSYDLVINVELRCSPELAPLAIRPMLKYDDFETTAYTSSRPEFHLHLTISCPASTYNKLPSNFVWELNASHHHKCT